MCTKISFLLPIFNSIIPSPPNTLADKELPTGTFKGDSPFIIKTGGKLVYSGGFIHPVKTPFFSKIISFSGNKAA